MKKITIRITEEQDRFLESNEKPNSEIIREALDAYITGGPSKKADVFDELDIPQDIISGKLEVGAQYRIVDIGDRIKPEQYDSEEDYIEEKKALESSLWTFGRSGLFINGSNDAWNLQGVRVVRLLDSEKETKE